MGGGGGIRRREREGGRRRSLVVFGLCSRGGGKGGLGAGWDGGVGILGLGCWGHRARG